MTERNFVSGSPKRRTDDEGKEYEDDARVKKFEEFREANAAENARIKKGMKTETFKLDVPKDESRPGAPVRARRQSTY